MAALAPFIRPMRRAKNGRRADLNEGRKLESGKQLTSVRVWVNADLRSGEWLKGRRRSVVDQSHNVPVAVMINPLHTRASVLSPSGKHTPDEVELGLTLQRLEDVQVRQALTHD